MMSGLWSFIAEHFAFIEHGDYSQRHELVLDWSFHFNKKLSVALSVCPYVYSIIFHFLFSVGQALGQFLSHLSGLEMNSQPYSILTY